MQASGVVLSLVVCPALDGHLHVWPDSLVVQVFVVVGNVCLIGEGQQNMQMLSVCRSETLVKVGGRGCGGKTAVIGIGYACPFALRDLLVSQPLLDHASSPSRVDQTDRDCRHGIGQSLAEVQARRREVVERHLTERRNTAVACPADL